MKIKESTQAIISNMRTNLDFAELDEAKHVFPETEWRTVAKTFISYLRLADSLVSLTDQEISAISQVNKTLSAEKAEQKHMPHLRDKKTGAADFLLAIGDEEKEKIRELISSLSNTSSETYKKAFVELNQMMMNAQEIKRQQRKPTDGDPLSDAAIWGYIEIKNPVAQMHFLINHFTERFISQHYRDAMHIDMAAHKDYFLNALVDVLAMNVAEGTLEPRFEEIVRIWSTPKPEGLGWLSQRRIEEYKKVLGQKEKKVGFAGEVRKVELRDLPAIKPILGQWLKDSVTKELQKEEVEEDLERMRGSINGNGYTYLVAEENGKVLGVMGLRFPEDRMLKYAKTERPAELVNAYVDQEQRGGRGIGKTLLDKLMSEAKSQRFTELVWNSGSRYIDTAWGFYDKIPGVEKLETVMGFYASGRPTRIWRLPLKD